MAVPKIRIKDFESEWMSGIIGNISNSFSGGTPTAGNHNYYGGNIPFIRSGEIHSDKTELFLTEEGLNSSSAKLVDKGNILYALYGATSGEVDVSKIGGAINQAILAILPKDNINKYFLCYLLQNKKEHIVNSLIQGGQGNLSGALIKSYLVNFADITEQEAISNYFQSLDLLIEATGKKIATLKQTKQASLQSMIPQEGATKPRVRFKGFTDEWKNIELSELFDFYKGRGLSKEKLNSKGQFNCILYGEIFTKYDFVVNDCISKTDIQEGFPSVCGDIIMPGSTTTSGIDLAKAVYVPFNEVLYGGDIIVLRPKIPKYINSFFIATLISCINRENIAMVSQGTTIVHLHAHNIAGLIYLIPSVEEQAKIAEYFSNLDKQIFIQEQRLDKLKQIKSACLKNMFV